MVDTHAQQSESGQGRDGVPAETVGSILDGLPARRGRGCKTESLSMLERCLGCDAAMSTAFLCADCGCRVCGECWGAAVCCVGSEE